MDIAGKGWWWVYPVEDTHTASDRKLSYAGLSTKYERPNRQEYSFLMFRKAFLWELNSFLMQTLYFVPINLHRCWPRDWKHSIAVYVFIYSKVYKSQSSLGDVRIARLSWVENSNNRYKKVVIHFHFLFCCFKAGLHVAIVGTISK